MNLIVTYTIREEKTSYIHIEPENYEGLEEQLKELSENGEITSEIELEEVIGDYIWEIDIYSFLPNKVIDEVLNISLKSPLIKQLVDQYKYLIVESCCKKQIGNYCSVCGKKLKNGIE